MVGHAASATETTLLTWSWSGRADVIARIVPSNSTSLRVRTVIFGENDIDELNIVKQLRCMVSQRMYPHNITVGPGGDYLCW